MMATMRFYEKKDNKKCAMSVQREKIRAALLQPLCSGGERVNQT